MKYMRILLAFAIAMPSLVYGLADSSAPTKMQIPFGNSAGGAYIRTVPIASQIGIQNGAASYTDGFPPLNFTPVNAGGVPPFGQDMNGILNAITSHTRWWAVGGPVFYDSSYQTAIGGYPKGACVQSGVTTAKIWCSTVDNNTSNPDTGGANWQYPNNAVTATNQSGGTVNATTGSFSGQITSTVSTGTAPFVVSSTTPVANMSIGGSASSANTVTSTINSGVVGTTQTAGDNSTKIATTAYVDRNRDTQIFTSNGTWTKPAGLSSTALVYVQMWGGGGGGSAGYYAGGGGGGYYEFTVLASDLGATESVVVGTGGALATAGGNSSFAGKIAYGGGGGWGDPTPTNSYGGGGGSQFGPGSSTTGQGGFDFDGTQASFAFNASSPYGGGGGVNGPGQGRSYFGGGGGGSQLANYAGNSVYGGGGGASETNTVYGTSVFGGRGGSSTIGAPLPPGGGGATSQTGARGEVRIFVR